MGLKAACALLLFGLVSGFQFSQSITRRTAVELSHQSQDFPEEGSISDRRKFIHSLGSLFTFVAGLQLLPETTSASVGSLPEFKDTNAIIQGITVNVADKPQQDAMIDFLVNGFDFKVLRKRIANSVEDTVRSQCICIRRTNGHFV